jgi:hypothetical protein
MRCTRQRRISSLLWHSGRWDWQHEGIYLRSYLLCVF